MVHGSRLKTFEINGLERTVCVKNTWYSCGTGGTWREAFALWSVYRAHRLADDSSYGTR